jgi:hypothetical protein
MDPSVATTAIISNIDVSPIVNAIVGVAGVGLGAQISVLGVRKALSFLTGLLRSA